MTTIREARQQLFELFATNKAGKPQTWINDLVKRIYDHEPYGGNLTKPASITIRTGGYENETLSYIFEIRVYIDASVDAQKSADLLDAIIDRIEFSNNGISRITSDFSPEDWETSFEPDIQAWGAICRVRYGRDF